MRKLRLVVFLVIVAALVLPTAAGARQDEPVVITMWHISTEAHSYAKVLVPAIERFNETHDDVKFEAQAIDNDPFKTQIQIAASAGEQPDVFQTWGGGGLKAFVDAGVVRPIPELQGDERFLPAALSPSTFNGEHYAVPATLAAIVLWINQDLFEEYDVELPHTWDQYLAACETFSANGIIPTVMGNKDRWPGGHYIAYLITRLGGPEPFRQALDREIGFDASVFVEAGARLREAVETGCFDPGFNGTSNEDAQAIMGLGLGAMRVMGNWDLTQLREIDPNLNLTVMHFPAFEDGAGAPTDMIGGTGQAFAVSADAPPETAAALIELLADPAFGQATVDGGFLSTLAGFESGFDDPVMQEISSLIGEATFMQLYYDQFMPPALAEAHLDTTQALFGLTISAEDAAIEMEKVATEELGPVQ